MKTKRPWAVIMGRELASYFSSPVAYIVCGLFLVFSGILFFSVFFIAGVAELRNFFEMLPLLFSLFIPALTMRVFSEELRSGTIETLLTLPVSPVEVVAGKYLASLVSALAMLVPTFSYVIACCIFGRPDMGPVVGGYLGAVLLAAAYTAIGLFASSLTRNQIVAFFAAAAVCAVLSLAGSFLVLLPGPVVSIVSFITASSHFESISRGIVDSRDILYFISLTALFIVFTVRSVQDARKG